MAVTALSHLSHDFLWLVFCSMQLGPRSSSPETNWCCFGELTVLILKGAHSKLSLLLHFPYHSQTPFLTRNLSGLISTPRSLASHRGVLSASVEQLLLKHRLLEEDLGRGRHPPTFHGLGLSMYSG